MFGFKKIAMATAAQALPGRDHAIRTAATHFVNSHALKGPYPEGLEKAMFGLGCFWSAEKSFWELGDGVYVTAVGYAGGLTPNPTYEEACSGRTGHNEVVLVVYDPKKISHEALLKTFWEGHDPTSSPSLRSMTTSNTSPKNPFGDRGGTRVVPIGTGAKLTQAAGV